MQHPFIPNWPDLRPFVAELWLVAAILAVLLAPFHVRKPNSACALIALAGLLGALVAVLVVGPVPAGGHFAAMVVQDGVAVFWKTILLLFSAGIVVLWFAASGSGLREGDGPEFFTLLLGATLGMSLMGSAANLLMIFLAVEAASFPSYILAGFRKTHRVGAEASIKYVVFGAASTAIMAYGLSLIYGLCGTLQLYSSPTATGVASRLAAGMGSGHMFDSPILAVAMVGLICGLGFKIAAVPMHFWCPDVFEGAPIDVTAFLSVASKGAGLVLLLRIISAIAAAVNDRATGLTTSLAVGIGIVGALTCTVGNTGAFVQDNIKRLLAYSSIAHAGYMLCALPLLVRHRTGGAAPGDVAASVTLLYLVVYLFMNLGAFTVAALVSRGLPGETGELLVAYRGLGRRSPVLAVSMTLCLFSLIGLPPLAGFTAKFNLMAVLAGNGALCWLLVGVIAVNTLLSVYYYARVIRQMYLIPDDVAEAPAPAPSRLGQGLSLTCAIMLIVLFLCGNWLTGLASWYGNTSRPAQDLEPTSTGRGETSGLKVFR